MLTPFAYFVAPGPMELLIILVILGILLGIPALVLALVVMSQRQSRGYELRIRQGARHAEPANPGVVQAELAKPADNEEQPADQ